MAILVDAAIWRWRGRRWAHLVSDSGYSELHDFARRLGLRREWFQGDHYDIPEAVRERALLLGAREVPATELVQRLRAAGLRRSRDGRARQPQPTASGAMRSDSPRVLGWDRKETVMPLDPQVALVLEAQEASGIPPYEEMSPEDARATYRTVVNLRRGPGYVPEPVAAVADRIVETETGPVTVRLYRPEGKGPLPVVVYFHGGGWVIGDIDTHDPQARMIANTVRAVVVNVHYRLAPEHRFPIPLRDCYAVTRWVVEHAAEIGGDPARVAVAGDSAGGNLATAVSLLVRNRNDPPLAAQLLVYPAVDATLSYPSVQSNGEGYSLTAKTMDWFVSHYLPDPAQRRDPLASPIFAEELSGLPPAIVATAEFDPLRDEGEAYAERLRGAGVAVTSKRYDGLIHGYFAMGGIVDAARAAVDESMRHLQAALHP